MNARPLSENSFLFSPRSKLSFPQRAARTPPIIISNRDRAYSYTLATGQFRTFEFHCNDAREAHDTLDDKLIYGHVVRVTSIICVINNATRDLSGCDFFCVSSQGPLVRNVLNIAGYQIPRSEQISGSGARNKKYDSIAHNYRLYNTALSLQEKAKQNEIVAIQVRDEYLGRILEDLTRDDLRQLVRYEDELSQAEEFEKIFPAKNSYSYLKFFEVERYYDRLLDAWEHRYSDNRTEGIRILRERCENMKHLETSIE